MTPRSLIIAAAAILSATTSMTSAAQAGGVRLQFGFPMGSFVARPTQSYQPSYHKPSHSYTARSHHAAAAAAERRERAAKARARAEAEARAEAKAEARAEAKAKASAAARLAAARKEKAQKDNSSKVAAITSSATVLAAQTPAQPAEQQHVLPATVDNGKPVETAALNNSQTVSDLPPSPLPGPSDNYVEPTAGNNKTETAPALQPEPTKPTKTAEKPAKEKKDKKEDCKRFIPFIGVTISVRCNE